MNLNEFPTLTKQLSAEKWERITVHLAGEHEPTSNRERFVQNPHKAKLEWTNIGTDYAVDALVYAAARADSNKNGYLKASRIFVLLASYERISTQLIQGVYGLEERQARRYMAACRLAIYLLSRHYAKQAEVTVPRTRALTLAEIRAAHKEETNGTAIQP